MQQFVSAQVYALRNHGARSAGRARPLRLRLGAAKRRRASRERFQPADGRVLDRLSAAVRDSAADNPTWLRSVRLERAEHLVRRRPRGGDAQRRLAHVPGLVAHDARVRLPAAGGRSRCGVRAGLTAGPGRRRAREAGGARRRDADDVLPHRGRSPRARRASSRPPSPSSFPAAHSGPRSSSTRTRPPGPRRSPPRPRAWSPGRSSSPSPAPLRYRRGRPGGVHAPARGDVDVHRRRHRPVRQRVPTSAVWASTPATLGTPHSFVGPHGDPHGREQAGHGPGDRDSDDTGRHAHGGRGRHRRAAAAGSVAAVRYGVAKRRLHVYVTVIDGGGRRVRTHPSRSRSTATGKVYARAAGRTTTGRMTFSRPASAAPTARGSRASRRPTGRGTASRRGTPSASLCADGGGAGRFRGRSASALLVDAVALRPTPNTSIMEELHCVARARRRMAAAITRRIE